MLTVLRSNGSIMVFRSMMKLSNFLGNCEMLDSRCKNFVAQKISRSKISLSKTIIIINLIIFQISLVL